MKWIFTVFAMVAIVGSVNAMPPEMAGKMQVGEIRGTLIKEGKPQSGQQVVIQVQQNGQTLLTLPKTTDAKGEFIFKNIFRDPQYSYTLLAEAAGVVYRNGPLHLSGKQEVLKVRFELVPKNAVDMAAEPLPPESPRMEHSHEKVAGQWQQQQLTSIILSAMVLIALAYAAGRYQRKK